MAKKLKVGIVGAPRGAGFVRAVQTVTETELVAVCDIREDVLNDSANRFGVEKRYTDYEAMVDSDLDIIIVSTPMPLHTPQAIMALERGKHVITEVPSSTDLEQCWQLVQAVEKSGC